MAKVPDPNLSDIMNSITTNLIKVLQQDSVEWFILTNSTMFVIPTIDITITVTKQGDSYIVGGTDAIRKSISAIHICNTQADVLVKKLSDVVDAVTDFHNKVQSEQNRQQRLVRDIKTIHNKTEILLCDISSKPIQTLRSNS